VLLECHRYDDDSAFQGGHTTEILKLVSSLEFTRYSPRIYIVSSGDSLSAEKARVLETSKASGSSPGNVKCRLFCVPDEPNTFVSIPL